ncbi:MAG: S8 family serine peptidase, partial [Actinobacteria bacterium]|nr:S8 family serine peptidase [Actinomycetota bacterium]NIU70668.1 S8 family serine peptidase [Actinomycetota bacterium]NIV90265.1 S8 family serine peptidase [Actinomycetota bacterium]NIW32571.1 S8 family serine peptidase [Actinomycetota bacterium]NIX24776.1 S8 family serine peptidase [Actinomycetota bacterium]
VVQSDEPDETPIWDRGLHGEGEIIGHIDGPVDLDSCFFRDPEDNTPGLGHRKVVAYRSTSGAALDPHGTHTAGTAGGDPFPVDGTRSGSGHAWAARLSLRDLFDLTGSGVVTSNLYTFFAEAHDDGARVHTNSWGDDESAAYTTWSRDVDRFTRDFEDAVV